MMAENQTPPGTTLYFQFAQNKPVSFVKYQEYIKYQKSFSGQHNHSQKHILGLLFFFFYKNLRQNGRFIMQTNYLRDLKASI